MTSTGVLIVLGLLALLGVWIVKDKTFDGMAPFVVLNGLALLGLLGTFGWMLFDWLTK
jgi:hypothetical protein